MNANDISLQNDSALKRIKRVSRLVRYVVLANLVCSVCIFVVSLSRFNFEFPEGFAQRFLTISLDILLEGFVFFWFWELARLFRFYEQGLIFAAQPIRSIKKLGVICLAGWLTMFVLNFMPRLSGVQFPKEHPGITEVVTFVPYDPFVSTPILFGRGFDFGLLVVGGTVIIAAWIMEEGRRLKVEQDLTV